MQGRTIVGPVPSRAGIFSAVALLLLFGGLVAAPAQRSEAADHVTLASLDATFHPGEMLLPPGDGEMKGTGCAACHRPEPGFSHPVGVIPSMAVPADLPLEDGRISCITCHASGDAAHMKAEQTGSPMLRSGVAGPGTLCMSCHDMRDDSRAAQHGSALGVAHQRWQGKAPGRASASASASGLDPESRTCLSCHDGLLSSDIALSGSAGNFASAIMDDHPVGVPYGRPGGARSSSGMPFGLRPLSALDPRIRLYDGQVGCNSCHSPYAGTKGLLVMDNQRSALCLSCHVE